MSLWASLSTALAPRLCRKATDIELVFCNGLDFKLLPAAYATYDSEPYRLGAGGAGGAGKMWGHRGCQQQICGIKCGVLNWIAGRRSDRFFKPVIWCVWGAFVYVGIDPTCHSSWGS